MPRLPTRSDLPNLQQLTTQWRVQRNSEGIPIIPGRYGRVEPHDSKTLASCLFRPRGLGAWVRKLPPHWRRWQIGDQEARVLLPIEELDRAAQTVRGYRRRSISPSLGADLARRFARM